MWVGFWAKAGVADRRVMESAAIFKRVAFMGVVSSNAIFIFSLVWGHNAAIAHPK
jgi:hypothetical protein